MIFQENQLSEEIQKQNRELQQMFGVRGYPTIWFVNPETKNQLQLIYPVRKYLYLTEAHLNG